MERTKKIEPVPVEEAVITKLRWRKMGGGSIRIVLSGEKRIIKPGEIFLADVAELPKSCLDLLECVDKGDLKASTVVKKEKEPFVPVEYTLTKVKGGKDLWNLVDVEGKSLNETPLSKVSAEELLNALKS